MQARLNYAAVAPSAYKAVARLEHHVSKESGLDRRLIHLLKLRASQINGCAYCVDMHTKEALSDGLSLQWVSLVCVWQESGVFDPRERALLAWTEAVTRVADSGVPDADFAALRQHFSDAEIVELTVAIGLINVWNRLAVSFRVPHELDGAA